MNGREEGRMGKVQGSDIGGPLVYFHMCKIWDSLGS